MAKPDSAKRAPNLFEDPAIAMAAKDDPFAGFIAKNWRQVVGTVIVAILVVWGYNTFKATNENKRAAASDNFADVRRSYSAYLNQLGLVAKAKTELNVATDDAAKKEISERVTKGEGDAREQKAKLERMIQSLEDNLVDPFPQLARLYRALVAVQDGDAPRVKSVLGSVDWETVGAPDSTERFVAELSALTLGKALADRDDSLQDGIKTLTALAERGTTAQVPATLALSAVVTTPEDKKKVEQIIREIQTQNPAQAKFLAPALERVTR